MNGERKVELVPLTEDDKEFLLTVYNVKRRFFFKVYPVLFVLAIFFGSRIDYRSRYSWKVRRWEETDDSKFLSRGGMRTVGICFLESIVIGTGLFHYYRKVLPYKSDVDSGVKEKIGYKIVRKEYFELIDKFYFAFDDPNHLHHEVDADTYHSCDEGDTMYAYRAVQSNHVFEENGRFNLF
ncbi:hypothetical protein CJD36_007165 [Flavipsychrobacter stenotrophus]|uniref:Uncharacterized protein n=1 Tax=Flavipsychrobacter stenotrophus TaxID=2077091 RepID=A0A2S7SXB7_9BACT|nr:hypothetical protein [Flavipsychrobacter stenotrophus]PQJ11569.1 hypothetical protein CJD36_007165 [Flavipsychrobacter stenotrophus]